MEKIMALLDTILTGFLYGVGFILAVLLFALLGFSAFRG